MEIDKWFQNDGPLMDTTENEAPWTLLTHKSRTLLQSPSSSITTKTRYEALTAVDLLLFHVGTNVTTRWNLGRINENYKALRVQAKSNGAQVILSSILPVRGKRAIRNRFILQINFWLCGWCHHECFGPYDHRKFFNCYSLSGKNGNHLSRRGKEIFGSRVATFMRWALN